MAVSLKEFIEANGKALGDKIEQELTPIYNPEKSDPVVAGYDRGIDNLLRKPFPVQEEVIKGLAKALFNEGRRRLFVCGEMGSGKTMLGLSVVAMSSRPLRTLVVCPGHLVHKWIREAKSTIAGVKTVDLAVKNVISILDALRQERDPLQTHEVWVISRERVKLNYGWRPAYTITKRSEYPRCPECGSIPRGKEEEIMTEGMLKKKKQRCHCGGFLWQATPKPKRFAPMEFIKKYLKGKFAVTILDEVHDYKAGDTLQGHAMGILATYTRYFMGLTGTLNGGYAENLFYLLYRLEPHRLKEFGYHGNEKWQKAYGVIEEVRPLDDSDHSYGRIKRRNIIIRKKPGVSPEVIGRYFLDKSCFIRLADVIDGLPPYDEIVVSVKMGPQRDAYRELENHLRAAVKQYKMKATAAMLQSLLSYPDSCVVFPEDIEIKDWGSGSDAAQIIETIAAPMLESKNLLPKERELVSLVKNEKEQGRKVLVYLTFTGTRDIRPRIRKILEDIKCSVGILPESVEPKKREAWIEKHSHEFDVLITNPELVKVGLDLVQFPTVVFYQTGYNIFTMRQAARRSWRISQTRPVKAYFFCYKNTMQETAISLIAKKMEVALLVEGDLPEGLAQYQIEGGSLIEEMAKALVEGRKYSGAETAWANFRKREIESNLGIGRKETVFTEKESNIIGKAKPLSKTTIAENTVVKVTVMEGKSKKVSRLSVRYGDLDSALKGKVAQFVLF